MTQAVKAVIIFCGFFLISSFAFADIIHFKDGRKVEGEIFKESTYSIKVKVDGRRRTFYRQDIERIDREGAPTSATEEPMAISEQKKELVRRLLEANGARENIARIFAQITAQSPQEAREQTRRLLNADEVIDQLVPVYANYYTEEDIQGLIIFFKSPVGQKHTAITPQIVEETMHETIRYFKEKVAALDDSK